MPLLREGREVVCLRVSKGRKLQDQWHQKKFIYEQKKGLGAAFFFRINKLTEKVVAARELEMRLFNSSRSL
jgi:hypothetical protein